MFADPPSERTVPANYSALRFSKTVILKHGDYDVFGDGTVIIKPAPGHSPAHQVLFLKLRKTGPVLLSGDLYHYPEERKLNRFPTTEFNRDQTAASRAAIEEFLKKKRRTALDPARLHRQREAEESAGVLRIAQHHI